MQERISSEEKKKGSLCFMVLENPEADGATGGELAMLGSQNGTTLLSVVPSWGHS